MPLSLRCPCGAAFEVEETFAGREVACPECQRPLRAPLPQRVPRRTSGLALASVVLAVAGTFTVVGTAAAAVLGALALVSVARHRDRLAGTGYALFGLFWGLIFTGLTLFALGGGELFGVDGWLRDAMLADDVSYDGPLEVERRPDGFAITRPSAKWGVVTRAPDQAPWPDDPDRDIDLMLIHVPGHALVDVTFDDVGALDLDQCQDRVLGWFRDRPLDWRVGREAGLVRFTHFQLHHSQRLKSPGGTEAVELLLDVRLAGQSRTYLVHLIKRGDDLFVVRGWTPKQRFARMEPEIRKAVESFRILDHGRAVP